MYKVRAFKELNAVLGIINGDLTADELNMYGNEVVRMIENKLMPGFTYLMDVTKFGIVNNDSVNESRDKIYEIEYFLSKMGLRHILIIGSNENSEATYQSIVTDNPEKIDKLYFTNLDEAINYLAEDIKNSNSK